MYSLFVSHQVEDQVESSVDISKSRFLEYTSEAISSQLESVSVEAIECIKSWPCIVMQEGRGQEVAHVVRITDVRVDGGEIKLTIGLFSGNDSLFNNILWKIRAELDIEQFEFSRNHWAFKDLDLFPILEKAGFSFDLSSITIFQNKQLPAPTRQELINARNVISGWSHTKIDDLLLEAGVSGLDATRAIGSRRDRANAIIKHTLANPNAKTVENSMLSVFIVKAVNSSPDFSENHFETRNAEVSDDEPIEDVEDEESDTRTPNRVFIVHGQNETARTSVLEVLTEVGLQGIILHEQANMGRHLLTKFIDEAELVTFAIILMTDDDVGGLRGSALAPRARQNVILELGFFLSHLGQQKVCALITPGLETPSDFDGIVYIRMDDEEHWKIELLRELRAAGLPLVEQWRQND
jgi:predicted nucleotide-binding protein